MQWHLNKNDLPRIDEDFRKQQPQSHDISVRVVILYTYEIFRKKIKMCRFNHTRARWISDSDGSDIPKEVIDNMKGWFYMPEIPRGIHESIRQDLKKIGEEINEEGDVQ